MKCRLWKSNSGSPQFVLDLGSKSFIFFLRGRKHFKVDFTCHDRLSDRMMMEWTKGSWIEKSDFSFFQENMLPYFKDNKKMEDFWHWIFGGQL